VQWGVRDEMTCERCGEQCEEWARLQPATGPGPRKEKDGMAPKERETCFLVLETHLSVESDQHPTIKLELWCEMTLWRLCGENIPEECLLFSLDRVKGCRSRAYVQPKRDQEAGPATMRMGRWDLSTRLDRPHSCAKDVGEDWQLGSWIWMGGG
jgi:hypothetical protein